VRFFWLFTVVLVGPASSLADSIPPVPPAAVEEPLPESALRRFGTTRFRPGAQQNFIAFSSDGRYLASGGYDGKLHIWEVPSGKELRSFPMQYNQINAMRFSPDGKFLAAGSSDGLIRVWSTGDWTERTPPPPPNRTWNPPFFDWLPDNKTLVRLGQDGRLRIQVAISGKELQSWHVGQINVAALATRPDGKIVVSQGYDHLLRAWDLTSGQEIKTFEVPANSARVYRSYPRLHFSADGKLLAASENERTILIWNTETGKIVRRLEMQGYFQGMALAPNGRVIATSAGDSTIRLWGVSSGRELRAFDTPRESATALTFSPDGKHLVSSGAAALRFWDIENDRELFSERGHRGAVSGVAFLHGSSRLVSIASDATLRYWDCTTGAELDRYSSLQSYFYGATMVAVDGGKSVLFPTGNMGLQRWTPAEGKIQFAGLSTMGGYVSSMAPDGEVAVTAAGTSYRVFDVRTGRELRSIEAPERQTNVNALSTGRRYFAAGHGYRDPFSQSHVSVYSLATGRRWRPLVPPYAQPMPAQRIVFSPDTRFLSVTYSNNETRVWELATGLPRLVLPADPPKPGEPYRNITAAVFTPDSRCLILGSSAGQLILCEMDRGEPLKLEAHRGPIQTLACSPDGERLASGSADTSILLWNLHELRRRTPQRAPLAAEPTTDDLEHAWNMLGTTYEKAVGEALWLLSQRAQATVPFLRTKLQPVRAPLPADIARWVAEVGDRRFATREKATLGLAAAGENARAEIVQALTGQQLNPEARRRLEQLLRRLEEGLTPVKLQPLRAIEALERLGAPEARSVLESLGQLTSDVVVKDEIVRTLERMKK